MSDTPKYTIEVIHSDGVWYAKVFDSEGRTVFATGLYRFGDLAKKAAGDWVYSITQKRGNQMTDKTKKIEPPTAWQYKQASINLAFDYCPPIHNCKKCGWPVIDGYCCRTCGDSDPGNPEDAVESAAIIPD
jgi:hypothetical protein